MAAKEPIPDGDNQINEPITSGDGDNPTNEGTGKDNEFEFDLSDPYIEPKSCPTCYNLIIDACGEEIEFPTGLAEGLKVRAQIEDKFGKRYRWEGEVGPDGVLSIEVSKFPAGLFTPFSGEFVLTLFLEDGIGAAGELCDSLVLTICEQDYDCIVFSFASTSYLSTDEEESY